MKGVHVDLIVAFFLGGAAGSAPFVWYLLKHRTKMRADRQLYKDRWQSAIELLQNGGQISDEQLGKLMPAVLPDQHTPIEVSAQQALLNEMFSEDRRDAEIERAKKGLPPLDNLNGMYSEDIAAVLKARAKHGTAG